MWRDQYPTSTKYEGFMNGGQEYKLVLEYYQSRDGAKISLGAVKVNLDKQPAQYTSQALEVAKNADLVIMAVGFNPLNEREAFDRTFEMPYNQSGFINEIAAVNKNIVVVLNSGGNVEMNSWIENTKALLMAWYPGQEGNLAAAEILFGLTNPSGKLPVSFEYNLEDNPCYNSYFDHDNDKKVFFNEGIFMGYRYWDKVESRPRFPFGFGLSYTSFTYSNIQTDKQVYTKEDTVLVNVTVKNTGNYKGAEAVQLYVSDLKSSLPRPLKELKGIDKVELSVNEEKIITFSLDKKAFMYYNPEKKDWVFEPGKFEILIGGSSVDIGQRSIITIHE
jgi:beta-glucosidase